VLLQSVRVVGDYSPVNYTIIYQRGTLSDTY